MKLEIHYKIYEWLKKQQLLQSIQETNHSQLKINQGYVQIPTNQTIYIDNGFLFAKILKKYLSHHCKQYQMLQKVRKISVLKADQNWMYIKLVMHNLGFQIDFNDPIDQYVILEMFQFLYEKFAPPQKQKHSLKKKNADLKFDILHFDQNKSLIQSKNLIEYMILLLMRTFNVTISQALGLIIKNCNWLKRLIKFGSKTNDFQDVLSFYDNFTENYDIFLKLLKQQQIHTFHVLQGITSGVFSESQQVCIKALSIFLKMKQSAWMKQHGFIKLVLSEYKIAFDFLLQNAYPTLKQMFNEDLPNIFKKKDHLLIFMYRFMKNLPKHLYGRQIIEPSFNFYIQKILQFLTPQTKQSNRQLARDVLMTAILNYHQKITQNNFKKILSIGFKYEQKINLTQNISKISTLFQILEYLMIIKSPSFQSYFKVALSYIELGNSQILEFTINNLKNLYQKQKQQFPIKYFLNFYPYQNRIAQNQDYQILEKIVNQPQLSQNQVAKCLDICLYFYLKELHCECFIKLIKILIKKKSGNWVNDNIQDIFKTWKQIIPKALDKIKPDWQYYYNPNDHFLSDQQSKQIQAQKQKIKNKKSQILVMGSSAKRKQIIKIKQFQKFSQTLISFLNVPDKKILTTILNLGYNYLKQLQKTPEKKVLIKFLKNYQQNLLVAIQNFQQSGPSYQLQNTHYLSHSQLLQNYSRLRQKNALLKKSETQQISQLPKQTKQNARRKQISLDVSFAQSQIQTQKNQFMNLSSFQKSYDSQQFQKQQKQYDPLFPFEQFDKIQNNVVYYTKQLLQQHQIVYLQMLFQKYDYLIDKIVFVYQKSDNNLQNFLKNLDLSKLTPLQEAETVWIKSKNSNPKNEKQFIQDFLTQLSMLVFTFQKNKSPQISCVQSFMKKLENNIEKGKAKYILMDYQRAQSESPSKKTKIKSYQINKDLKFAQKISPKYQIYQSFLICFKVLNEIFEESFNSYLIQPISEIVNKVDTPSLSSAKGGNQQTADQEFQDEQDNMEKALKQFEQSEDKVMASSPNIRKQKKSTTVAVKQAQNIHQEYLHTSIVNLGLQKSKNAKLRQKLSQRRQQIQKKLRAMIKKNSDQKNNKNNIDQKSKSSNIIKKNQEKQLNQYDNEN